jgi:hypothetical protein
MAIDFSFLHSFFSPSLSLLLLFVVTKQIDSKLLADIIHLAVLLIVGWREDEIGERQRRQIATG